MADVQIAPPEDATMPFTIDLTGRRALVTGAGRHTGRRFSLALAAAGAEVAVNDLKAELAQAVVDEILAAGGKAQALPFDVTDGHQVQEKVGGFSPDILVNNTGGTDAIKPPFPNFEDTEPSDWDHFVQINMYGTFHCTKAALPGMKQRGWGRIITMVSDSARRGERGLAVYAAAKAGAAGFIRSIAAEVGRDGITANCISLGTLMYEGMGDLPDEVKQKMSRPYAMKRLGTPDDPVGMVMLLASDQAGWITGQVIPVNGGYTNAL